MKLTKLLMSALAVTMICSAAQATSWTVSNDGGRPAQFTTIQAAVDAASPSDTILITGGSYAGFTTVKNLVFYGESIEAGDFPVTQITGAVNFYRLNSSLSASGSRAYGIRFNSTVTINGNFSGASAGQRVMSDFIFERCRFQNNQTYYYWYDGLSDVTIRNCYFANHTYYVNAGLYASGLSNFLITNCVFDNSYTASYFNATTTDYNGNMVMRNNLFLNRTTDNFLGFVNIVLENNIFYKSEPTGLQQSTFNNNLTYLCNNNAIPYGDNLGSGNIEATDPEFINYPALGGAHSWSYDYGLEATSPAAGTGTNGTDIGLTGGNAPVNQLPIYAKIPGVTLLDIPVSSVPVGGTLQIQIEAESRD